MRFSPIINSEFKKCINLWSNLAGKTAAMLTHKKSTLELMKKEIQGIQVTGPCKQEVH